MNKKRAAVFLDRDGVINKKSTPHDYIKNWKEFEFLPSVPKAIKKLNKKFLVIVATNQRGIDRGLMSLADLNDIHSKMKKKLQNCGAKIDAIYFCPHNIKDNCDCHKPKPGMILKAAEDFKIDLLKSYIIGDDMSDIETGKRVGCKTFLISNFQGNLSEIEEKGISPDYIVSNLFEVAKILQESEKREKNK